ncbi:MAG: TfoX/Sxy family protein [Alphaproteobacteria bacterium]|nr:TfoX/Sxy family protein [Alphaproteobacteria bacterium]
MSYTASFAEELLGLMEGLGKVTTKKMFGALGFYRGPAIFACLFDGDVFYLKAQGAFADELKAVGSQPFIYHSKNGRSVAMPYMTAPQACLEDADEMTAWCNKALAALAAKPKAPATKKAAKRG